MDNQTRRILLERVKASGFPGSILDVFQNPTILDEYVAQQQQPIVAQTPQEQEQGLRPAHAAGNVGQSMIFPDVQPNQSFNTVGMKIPINIDKVDDQGNLVESYKAVPPGIQNLPTGPNRGMVIESPAKGYQKGGFHQKIYTDPEEFRIANKAYNDSLTVYNAPKIAYDRATEIDNAFYNGDFQKVNDLLAKPYPYYNAFRRLTILNHKSPQPVSGYPIYLGFNPSNPLVPKFKKPTEEPVYQEKPKVEPIKSKDGKFETSKLMPIRPTLMPPSNTMRVLRAIQEEDKSNKYMYPPRIVAAPEFKTGGVKKYQTAGTKEKEDLYAGPQLNQVTVQGEKPSWVKDKESKTPDDINWYETLNFKKWGLKDYSNYSSFNSAFRNARESGEKEFVWNDKRYNTDLIPKATSDKYWDAKRFLQDYYTNEPFTPFDTSSTTLYDFYDDYTKKKYGYTWLDYFDKIKNTPQYLNPQSEEDQNTYDKYRDTLHLLEKPNFYSEYSDEAKAALKDRAKNKYIEALNDPNYYFSITSKPDPKNPILGYVDGREGKNKIYVSDKGNTNDFTTFVHELSHKGDSKSRIDYYGANSRIPDVDVDAINKFGTSLTQDRFDYVSDPSETEARKMSTLYFMDRVLNKDIRSGKITENDLQELYDTYHKEGGYGRAKSMPDDIQDLLELYKWQKGDLLKYLNNDFTYKKKRTGGADTTQEVASYKWRTGRPKESRKTYIVGGLKNRVLYNKAKYKR